VGFNEVKEEDWIV